MNPTKFRTHAWKIVRVFLKLGAMSYGGPAMMGIMQNEVQEKWGWLTKENFVEGLALVNMLPGPGATQLGIFLGYVRGSWWPNPVVIGIFAIAVFRLGQTANVSARGR